MKDIPIPGLCGFRLCTLTDEELLQRIAFGLQAMYSEPVSVPTRNIPARPNEDFDLLVGELMIRFMDAIGDNIPFLVESIIGNVISSINQTKERALKSMLLKHLNRIPNTEELQEKVVIVEHPTVFGQPKIESVFYGNVEIGFFITDQIGVSGVSWHIKDESGKQTA